MPMTIQGNDGRIYQATEKFRWLEKNEYVGKEEKKITHLILQQLFLRLPKPGLALPIGTSPSFEPVWLDVPVVTEEEAAKGEQINIVMDAPPKGKGGRMN